MKRRAILFCVLSYSLSWGWWVFRLLPLWRQSLETGLPLDRAAIGPFDIPIGMFAPLVSALLLRGGGLPLSLGIKRPVKLYLLAVSLPILAVCANLLILGGFTWAGDAPGSLLLSLIPIMLIATLTALGEEFGWRGFLLPILLPLGKTRAALIVGAVWGLWHLPILLSGLTYPGFPVFFAVPGFIASVILLSFWFTEVFTQSNGSVLLAMLTHGMLNALGEIASLQHVPGANPLFINPFGLSTALLLFIFVWVWHRSIHLKTFQMAPERIADE